MSEVKMDPYVVGFGLSAAIIAVFNGILNVVKELFVLNGEKILKDGILKPIGGLLGKPHHWIGHGIVILLLFVIIGLVISLTTLHESLEQKLTLTNNKLGIWIFVGTVLGIVIIGLFYFWEAFLL